jgi:hypothetical protein
MKTESKGASRYLVVFRGDEKRAGLPLNCGFKERILNLTKTADKINILPTYMYQNKINILEML